ncbi:MAG TPA: cell division protein ZipA [Cellvibrio sp.]|nr:cell division protein ZipA [Cellvibrio sp.]
MQEWVTVIIVLLILAILLDGVRRMRINQRDKIRMSRSIHKQGGGAEATKEYTSELPNGGARVVGYREVPQGSTVRPPRKPAITPNNAREPRRAPEQTRLNLDESVPLLMESVSDDVLMRDQKDEQDALAYTRPQRARMSDQQRIEPTFSALDDDEPSTSPSRTAHTAPSHDEEDDAHRDSADGYRETDYPDEDDDYADEPYSDADEIEDDYADDYDGEDYDDDDDYEDADDYEDEHYDGPEETPVASTDQPPKEPEEVLIINVMSMKGEFFKGAALLDIILKCGMRYGDMNIFHRYSDKQGEGALLFSMANMVKPGTFDLDAMDNFETPGVSLFMTLPIKADSMASFDLMVDTARAIAETLGGELKDEQRSVMTRQTIEHCRQRIRDYELKKLSRSRH